MRPLVRTLPVRFGRDAYTDPLHLAPPVVALVLYVCGLWLSYSYLMQTRRIATAKSTDGDRGLVS